MHRVARKLDRNAKGRLALTRYPLVALPLLSPRGQNATPVTRVDNPAVLVVERGRRVPSTNSILAIAELADDTTGGPWAIGCEGELTGSPIAWKVVVLEDRCGY
jgi:hypothetical protein